MRRRSQRLSTSWALVGALPLLLLGAGAFAGPAAPSAPAPGPTESAPEAHSPDAAAPDAPQAGGGGDGGTVDKGVDRAAARAAKSDMESAMAELGDLAAGAKRDSDLVRAACVLDKQDRGQGVMELGTGELLILGDPNATPQEQSFASDKLQAAAVRMRGLVKEAQACSGETSPEKNDNVARNELDEQDTIPLSDPTQGGATPPVPTPVDPTTPQTVASPTQ